MQFFASLQSEWIKRRKSSINWLILVGGLFIPVIILFDRIISPQSATLTNMSPDGWMEIFTRCWQYMAVFIMPMGIILAASLLTQIEYRNNTWKQVYTSPQSLNTIFWAKHLVLFIILLQYFIVLTFGLFIAGYVPSILNSRIPFPVENFPLVEITKKHFQYILYVLPVLSLQYLLSLQIRNFVISISIGFVLLVASLIAMNWHYGYIIPYSYGALDYLKTDNNIDPDVNITKWAIGYFIVFTLINYFLFLYRSQSKFSKFISRLTATNARRVFSFSASLLLVIAGGYLFSLIGKKPLKAAFSQTEFSEKIVEAGNNLGSFQLDSPNAWSVEDRMKHYNVKGVSIALIDNYKVVWAKGYGWADSSAERKVDTNTLFIPGSLSKSINALAFLQLVEQKKLNLFDDINTQLKSWKFPYNSKISGNKKISPINLLTHTAGLSVHGFYGYKNGDSLPDIYQILDGKYPANSEAIRSVIEPNKKMEYSGGGTMISQLLIMDATGKAYDKYLNEAVFQPLQMNNSFFTQPPPTKYHQFLATGYDSLGKEIKGKYPLLMEQAAGGLWTTPTDFSKYIIEMQLSLKGKSNKILSKSMIEMMLTPYLDNSCALGVFVTEMDGHKYFGHGASNVGFSGNYYGSFENGRGLVIFINSENPGIIQEIANSFAQTLEWEGFPKKKSIKPLIIEQALIDKYVGTYQAKDAKGKPFQIEIVQNGKNCEYCTDTEKRKMYFYSKTGFVCLESPTEKKFITGTNGEVIGFNSKYEGQNVRFSRVKN